MPYRWGFELFGTNWVESLSWGLHGPDVAIIRQEDDAMPPLFFWSSTHLDDDEDEAVIAERAGNLKTLFDGALYLVRGYGFRPEPLGTLFDLYADLRKGHPEVMAGERLFSAAACARPLSQLERDAVCERLIAGSIYTARTDFVVRGLLELLGTQGITFASLYSLRDTMKTHGMPELKQWTAAQSSKAEWDLFRHTANNYQVSGPNARHGDLGQSPPAEPMSLERASEIILQAAKAFVRARIARATASLRSE